MAWSHGQSSCCSFMMPLIWMMEFGYTIGLYCNSSNWGVCLQLSSRVVVIALMITFICFVSVKWPCHVSANILFLSTFIFVSFFLNTYNLGFEDYY